MLLPHLNELKYVGLVHGSKMEHEIKSWIGVVSVSITALSCKGPCVKIYFNMFIILLDIAYMVHI